MLNKNGVITLIKFGGCWEMGKSASWHAMRCYANGFYSKATRGSAKHFKKN